MIMSDFLALSVFTVGYIPGKCGRPLLENPGCETMVGGAGDPNHGAWGQVLVFSLEKSLFYEIFCLPLLRGFYSQNWLFEQKQASFFSRSGEVGLSRPGEILGRETPLWAAQEANNFRADWDLKCDL